MGIKELAQEINSKSADYEIGNLQSIRKNIKGLMKRPGSAIFAENTIYEHYAFHYGGRSEIQFNIGTEEEGIRYGLAFSLEPSQSLPDVSILYPKILKLNCLIREHPEFFKQFRMWHYITDERSDITEVVEIRQELISTKIFIFFGKIATDYKIKINEILQTFDELLWVYKIIETDGFDKLEHIDEIVTEDFIYANKNGVLPAKVNYTIQEREINVDIRHSYLQEILQAELEETHGRENVRLENRFNANEIDLVVRTADGFHFYEVKTASSAKACVRQAIGQLLEYAYGNGRKNASKVFIAGEFPIDKGTDKYLIFLRNEFKIPIFYKLVKI
jgi:hypothetical protein